MNLDTKPDQPDEVEMKVKIPTDYRRALWALKLAHDEDIKDMIADALELFFDEHGVDP